MFAGWVKDEGRQLLQDIGRTYAGGLLESSLLKLGLTPEQAKAYAARVAKVPKPTPSPPEPRFFRLPTDTTTPYLVGGGILLLSIVAFYFFSRRS